MEPYQVTLRTAVTPKFPAWILGRNKIKTKSDQGAVRHAVTPDWGQFPTIVTHSKGNVRAGQNNQDWVGFFYTGNSKITTLIGHCLHVEFTK